MSAAATPSSSSPGCRWCDWDNENVAPSTLGEWGNKNVAPSTLVVRRCGRTICERHLLGHSVMDNCAACSTPVKAKASERAQATMPSPSSSSSSNSFALGCSVCGTMTARVCAKCKCVAYCSDACEGKDAAHHAKLCGTGQVVLLNTTSNPWITWCDRYPASFDKLKLAVEMMPTDVTMTKGKYFHLKYDSGDIAIVSIHPNTPPAVVESIRNRRPDQFDVVVWTDANYYHTRFHVLVSDQPPSSSSGTHVVYEDTPLVNRSSTNSSPAAVAAAGNELESWMMMYKDNVSTFLANRRREAAADPTNSRQGEMFIAHAYGGSIKRTTWMNQRTLLGHPTSEHNVMVATPKGMYDVDFVYVMKDGSRSFMRMIGAATPLKDGDVTIKWTPPPPQSSSSSSSSSDVPRANSIDTWTTRHTKSEGILYDKITMLLSENQLGGVSPPWRFIMLEADSNAVRLCAVDMATPIQVVQALRQCQPTQVAVVVTLRGVNNVAAYDIGFLSAAPSSAPSQAKQAARLVAGERDYHQWVTDHPVEWRALANDARTLRRDGTRHPSLVYRLAPDGTWSREIVQADSLQATRASLGKELIARVRASLLKRDKDQFDLILDQSDTAGGCVHVQVHLEKEEVLEHCDNIRLMTEAATAHLAATPSPPAGASVNARASRPPSVPLTPKAITEWQESERGRILRLANEEVNVDLRAGIRKRETYTLLAESQLLLSLFLHHNADKEVDVVEVDRFMAVDAERANIDALILIEADVVKRDAMKLISMVAFNHSMLEAFKVFAETSSSSSSSSPPAAPLVGIELNPGPPSFVRISDRPHSFIVGSICFVLLLTVVVAVVLSINNHADVVDSPVSAKEIGQRAFAQHMSTVTRFEGVVTSAAMDSLVASVRRSMDITEVAYMDEFELSIVDAALESAEFMNYIKGMRAVAREPKNMLKSTMKNSFDE